MPSGPHKQSCQPNKHVATVRHRTDGRRILRAGFDWGSDSVQGGRDEQTTTRHTNPAMRRLRRRSVHTADFPKVRRGAAVRHGPSEREVCDLRALLLRHAYGVHQPAARPRRPGCCPRLARGRGIIVLYGLIPPALRIPDAAAGTARDGVTRATRACRWPSAHAPLRRRATCLPWRGRR
jgi:hypothetical protein